MLENTLVFLVADHGTMSSSGRFWYGFHPNEEATRVPVILFNAGKTGKDDRLFETIDVSKTIIDYFGDKNFPNPRAASLLSNTEKAYTGTLTLRSDLNREWFLIIHKQNLNYEFNLHPESAGEAKKFVVNHFEVTNILEGQTVLQEVLPEVKEMMAEYRIYGFEVHSNYRKLVPKELQ